MGQSVTGYESMGQCLFVASGAEYEAASLRGLAWTNGYDLYHEMTERSQAEQLEEVGLEMLPAGFALEVATVADDLSELSEVERARIEAWAAHRQSEFATGRRCARRVLLGLGCEDRPELQADADGVPSWPEGFAGSITHSRGMAAAVAARVLDCTLLGLDLERTNRLGEAASRRVVHPSEERFVQGDLVKASIIFSLKEAFYKAQFPRDRRTGNFEDLALRVDAMAGSAEVFEMAPRFAEELKDLRFAYRLVGDYVLSACWLA